MRDQKELSRLMNEEMEGNTGNAIDYIPIDLKKYLDEHVPKVAIKNYLSFFQ